MNDKEFERIFNNIAKTNKFEPAFGGWFKETAECIVILDLQKSNFGNYYELNFKIFIQGLFGKNYFLSKELIKKEIGNIFRRQPNEYADLLDLNLAMKDNERIEKIETMFQDFIRPFSDKVLTIDGIKELARDDKIKLLDSVKNKLGL